MLNKNNCTTIKSETPHMHFQKKQIYLTGELLSPVRPGRPAVYLYQGNTIQTSRVVAILEASKDFICFETRNSIYRLEYTQVPSECYGQCA